MMNLKLLITLGLCVFIQACVTTEIAVKEEKKDLLALRDDAVIAYNNGQYEKALRGFNELVEEVSEDSELWFKKANTHARLFQSDEAIEAYQKALLRDPNHFKAWRNLSLIQLRQAANSLTQLMKVLPTNHPLYDSSLLLTYKTMDVLNTKPVLPKKNVNEERSSRESRQISPTSQPQEKQTQVLPQVAEQKNDSLKPAKLEEEKVETTENNRETNQEKTPSTIKK